MSLFQPGHNCWKVAHADRLSFLIDGAAYFPAVRQALTQARYQVYILGWDIDSRLHLLRENQTDDLPQALGDFLDALVKQHKTLQIHILIWDFAMIYLLEREFMPLYKLGWQTHSRLHFRLDDTHPVGASHHQKLVVIDNKIAFCGGFDLSKWRWDHSTHAAHDPCRRDPENKSYQPFHDIEMLLAGDVAAALAELSCVRWQHATGHSLTALQPPAEHDPWPSMVSPDLTNVPVAILRSQPAWQEQPEIREIEQFYHDAIAQAENWIYIENQYLTCTAITKSLCDRLQAEKGPEIVIILPEKTGGWLEQTTMDVLRARIVRQLWAANHHQRLRIYYPAQTGLAEAECIMVHAKLLIIDDRIVTIGSANLSNRSMGFDTECNLALDALEDEAIRPAITHLHQRLLAEHLSVSVTTVAQTFSQQQKLIATIEALQGQPRTLAPLQTEVSESVDEMIPDDAMIDPERPVDPDALMEQLLPKELPLPTVKQWFPLIGLIIIMLGLTVVWHWTPVNTWLESDAFSLMIEEFRTHPLSIPFAILGMTIGGILAMPASAMILVISLIFGPWLGFTISLIGAVISSILGYGLGYITGRHVVRQLSGAWINKLSQQLAQRGILTIITVRIVPVAPFAVINLVAGASHISFRDYLVGTFFGMWPGILAITVFADSLFEAIRDPDVFSVAVVFGVLVLAYISLWGLRRWLIRRNQRLRTTDDLKPPFKESK